MLMKGRTIVIAAIVAKAKSKYIVLAPLTFFMLLCPLLEQFWIPGERRIPRAQPDFQLQWAEQFKFVDHPAG